MAHHPAPIRFMKNRTRFIKAICATSALGLSALLTDAAKASIAPSVNISTPSTQNFVLQSGTESPSTIQYNGSQGQNNNFAVGTNTNFGVNASASSTPDYSVASKATFGSEAGTSFTNQIGSSGAAAASDSFSRSASTSAQSAVDYAARSAFTAAHSSAGTLQTALNSSTDKVAYQAGWESIYKASSAAQVVYSSAFDSAFKTANSGNSSSNEAGGTISGNFVSQQNGSGTNTAGSSSTQKLFVQETANSVDTFREATAEDYKAKLGGASVTLMAAGAQAGSYNAATSEQVANAASSSLVLAASSSNSNAVTVKGIGAEAVFKSGSSTMFDSDISSNLGKVVAGTGSLILNGPEAPSVSSSATASGSAGGNFGTNSTASSNSATYSSVFYQAF